MVSRMMFASAFAFATTSATSSTSYSTCLTDIRDPSVPLVKMAITAAKDHDIPTTLEKVHGYLSYFPPSIETCLSNFNPTMVLGHLVTELGPCVGEVMPLLSLGEWTNLKNHWPKSLDDADAFIAFLKGTPDCAFSNICTPLVAVMNNCLNKALPTLFFHLKHESNGCCDAFFDNAKSKVGQDAGRFLIELGQHLISTICTVQTPGFDSVQAQHCGTTLKGLILGESALNTLTTMMPSLTMPNNMACSAYNGGDFTSTLGTVGKLPGADQHRVYGACSASLDGLLSFIAELPIFQTSPLVGLLAEGQVLEGNALLDVVVSLKPELACHPAFDTITAIMSQLNFHVANHFSKTCDFVDAAFPPTFTAYPVVIGPTPAPTVPYVPVVDPIQTKVVVFEKDPVQPASSNAIVMSMSGVVLVLATSLMAML